MHAAIWYPPALAQDATALSPLVAGAIGVVIGVIVGALALRLVTGETVARAREEGETIRANAQAEAETIRDRAELAAEKRSLEEREKFEKDVQSERDAIRDQEKRLSKREDQYERKNDALNMKEERVAAREKELASEIEVVKGKQRELDQAVEKQKDELLRVAGMSAGEAKEVVLRKIEESATDDAAGIVRKATEDAQAEARERAREIVLSAVQRYAGEFVSEGTARSVAIPSDDMKGRIIGREGRNIRAIEKAAGVDLIVDDTPGVIVVSCFDKVRQSIAAEAMERLIQDGRIHPTRIEEVVEKVTSEFDEKITKRGREAVSDMKLRRVHQKVSDAMGRLAFRTSYGQNVLQHSMEVGAISGMIADLLGLDGRVAKRCGFLHDIGKAMDHDQEGTHPQIGYDFAKQYNETEPVLNAILAHHGDVPATSFYTPIVMAADALSGARPGARRESLERYIKRLEELQGIALAEEGVVEAHAIQAGREVRVMVDASRVNDDKAFLVAKRIADRVSDEMTFPGEIRVTVLRETRAIELAR
ncbi:MAG: ribonuclease Y [Planctomycetota bacterium]